MKNGVSIYGGFAGDEDTATFDLADRNFEINETVLSGDIGISGLDTDNCYHVFYHPDGTNLDNTAVLDGVTITRGKIDGIPPYRGSGMYNNQSNPMLRNCKFSENSSYAGGGLCNDNYSNPTLINCTFNGNSVANAGGGVSNVNHSSPRFINCTFSRNSAGYGGGMSNYHYSQPRLVNCTFSENSANYGSGMWNEDGSPATLTNCILWGNTASVGSQIYNYAGQAAAVTYSCIQDGYFGVGNIDVDPLLVDAPGGNLRLQAGSPSIDAGYMFIDAGEYDMDGKKRQVDASDTSGWDVTIKGLIVNDDDTTHIVWRLIDMGAYEYQRGCTPLEFTLQSRDDLDTGLWRDRYTGFAGAWTDTEAVGLGKRFYRVIGDYAVEQSVVGISAVDALALLDQRFGGDCFTVLDVRTAGEYATRHIIGAVNIDFYSPTFADQLNAFDKGRTYLVHCASGGRSAQAAQMMEALGFVEVYDLLGGISAFQSVPGSAAYLEP